MGAMSSQITSVSIVYSAVCLGADQRKHQNSASLAFVRGIHRGPVNSPHKGPVTRKMFPSHDIQIQIQIQKRFIETHRHMQQRYIRSLYNSKHSLEIAPAGTHRDNSATFTSKRRCYVAPKQNDAAITPRVRRE